MGSNMDIMKKFRYNFHYWLRNCYQAQDVGPSNSQIDTYHLADDAVSKTEQAVPTSSSSK